MSTPEKNYNCVIFEAIPMITIRQRGGYGFIIHIYKQIKYRNRYKSEITYMLFNFYIRNIYYVDLEIESAVHIRNMSDEYSLPAMKVAAKSVALIDEILIQCIVVSAVFQ